MVFFFRVFIMVGILTSNTAMASADKFISGGVIKSYGKYAKVEQDLALDKNSVLKVAFDIGTQGKVGEVNRKLETLARFINMHVAHGIALENIKLAAVVHGKAGFDLLKAALYQEKYKQKNANNALLKALINNHVKVYLCGQSAAYHDISKDMLAPGVNMALSAMTAHAILQGKGYSLNPF